MNIAYLGGTDVERLWHWGAIEWPPTFCYHLRRLHVIDLLTLIDSDEAERKKKEREERKQERQKALAEKKAAGSKSGGRAMKLGAKKLAKD